MFVGLLSAFGRESGLVSGLESVQEHEVVAGPVVVAWPEAEAEAEAVPVPGHQLVLDGPFYVCQTAGLVYSPG